MTEQTTYLATVRQLQEIYNTPDDAAQVYSEILEVNHRAERGFYQNRGGDLDMSGRGASSLDVNRVARALGLTIVEEVARCAEYTIAPYCISAGGRIAVRGFALWLPVHRLNATNGRIE